jgi:hypothetical protein
MYRAEGLAADRSAARGEDATAGIKTVDLEQRSREKRIEKTIGVRSGAGILAVEEREELTSGFRVRLAGVAPEATSRDMRGRRA